MVVAESIGRGGPLAQVLCMEYDFFFVSVALVRAEWELFP